MMTEEQIKHMVDRFLSWRLPKPWHPDNGISYQRPNYAHPPADHDWPTGTNLFDGQQATEMVRYMLQDLPAVPPQPPQPDERAEQRGAEMMRERAAQYIESCDVGAAKLIAPAIRALRTDS